MATLIRHHHSHQRHNSHGGDSHRIRTAPSNASPAGHKVLPVHDASTQTLSTALRDAYFINEQFIEEGSPFEVNLSNVLKQAIHDNLSGLTTSLAQSSRERHLQGGAGSVDADELLLLRISAVFDDANAEVLRLMQTNRYAPSKQQPSVLSQRRVLIMELLK
jgi:hypothetical protein